MVTSVAAAALVGAGTRPARAAPRRGGTARIGVGDGSTSDSLDPATYASTFMQLLGFAAIGNALTEVDETGNVVPDLAESWESDDARLWAFRLMPGVEFHNGKSLTAADVIASMNHHRGEASTSAARSLADMIADIRADGERTVLFELAETNADFPFLVNDYHFVILPSDGEGKVDATAGVGTGAYVLNAFEPGVRASVTRFANYHKADRGWFDGIEFILVNDEAARQAALLTGEVDIINRVPLDAVSRLSGRNGIRIVEVTGNQHFTFPMHVDAAPFNDVNVRLALKYGIDRKAIVDTVLRGHGAPANDHPIGPANKYFAANLEQRAYDPDRARFHLREAGLESLAVDLSVSDAPFPGAVDAAVLFREAAARAGIDVNVVREPIDGYWSNVWLKKPFCASYWGGRPTEDWMFTMAYAAGAAWNETRWTSERFETLLRQGRATLDETLRGEIYREMQEIVRDDGGALVYAYGNYIDAASPEIGVPDTVSNQWELDGFRAVDRWWFV